MASPGNNEESSGQGLHFMKNVPVVFRLIPGTISHRNSQARSLRPAIFTIAKESVPVQSSDWIH